MGRKKSTCIQYFDLTKDETSRCEKARCRFCGWVSAKNTVRMKIHLAKGCKECPENIKTTYLGQLDDDESEGSESAVSGQPEFSEEGDVETQLETSRASEKRRRTSGQKSPRKRKRKNQPTRSTHVADDHREIDRALADFLFAANLPLATVENPFFVAFCKKLRPSYNVPSRHRVVTQNFLSGATPVQMAYHPIGMAHVGDIPQPGTSGVVANQQGTHQVPAVVSSSEQQPGTSFHLIRIGTA